MYLGCRVVVLILLLLPLSACGKKGPLYLPDPARTLVTAG